MLEKERKGRRGQEGVKKLAEALLSLPLLASLISLLPQLSVPAQAERSGLYHLFSLLENLLSLFPERISTALLSDKSFLKFITTKTSDPSFGEGEGRQNWFYVVELTSMLLQNAEDKEREKWAERGLEGMLKLLSGYRKRDPRDGDEVEFMENGFNCICEVLGSENGKRKFLDEEGEELMGMMIKEKLMSRTRAIKVIDHLLSSGGAATGGIAKESCEKFVEIGCLKSLFNAFMGKGSKKEKEDTSSDEHILGILVSLFTNLDSDSTQRIRLLAKFAEKDYEKVDRLLEIREGLVARVEEREREVKKMEEEEDLEFDEDELYIQKLEGGLFALQMVDYILAWVIMEDDGAKDHTAMLLKRKGMGIKDIVSILESWKNNIGDDKENELEGVMDQKEVLEGLLGYLREVA